MFREMLFAAGYQGDESLLRLMINLERFSVRYRQDYL